MLRKIKLVPTPVLKVHKYIVLIFRDKKVGSTQNIKYCLNLKEVDAVLKSAIKGDVIEVYSAKHSLKQAYFKE